LLQVVGISEMLVSGDPTDVLVTYSLGSCIGLAVYDPVLHVGALIHCMLPLSSIDLQKAQRNPFMFTDTGVSALLKELFGRGATRNRLIAKVAGASNLLDDQNRFNIGQRNMAVLRKILWKNGILLAKEDVGGSIPRSVYFHVVDGRTVVRASGQEYEL